MDKSLTATALRYSGAILACLLLALALFVFGVALGMVLLAATLADRLWPRRMPPPCPYKIEPQQLRTAPARTRLRLVVNR